MRQSMLVAGSTRDPLFLFICRGFIFVTDLKYEIDKKLEAV